LTVSVFDRYQTDYGSDFSKVANPAPSGHNILSLHAKADPMQLISGGASSGVDLVLKIDNLLDETYWVPEWGGRPLNSLPGTLGRTIYGGLSVSL
jgi:outer membrane receptor protein involved in Fe transport